MDRSGEFERWLQRAIDDQVAFGCAMQFARNRHLAEDILQEAYRRALEHWHEIKSEEHLRNRLRYVVVNLVRDHVRRRKNQTQSLQGAEVIPDERTPLLDAEEREHLMHYLAQLPADDRRLIELSYCEGLTLQEIRALHPGWGSVSTIWKRRKAACERLRALMSQGELGMP